MLNKLLLFIHRKLEDVLVKRVPRFSTNDSLEMEVSCLLLDTLKLHNTCHELNRNLCDSDEHIEELKAEVYNLKWDVTALTKQLNERGVRVNAKN